MNVVKAQEWWAHWTTQGGLCGGTAREWLAEHPEILLRLEFKPVNRKRHYQAIHPDGTCGFQEVAFLESTEQEIPRVGGIFDYEKDVDYLIAF